MLHPLLLATGWQLLPPDDRKVVDLRSIRGRAQLPQGVHQAKHRGCRHSTRAAPPRVSPTERIRAEIDQLFCESIKSASSATPWRSARGGARLLLQSALEAEVTEFLCRDRYERRVVAKDPWDGSRNGYGSLTVKTTAGPLTLARPKLGGHDRAVRVTPARKGRDQDERARVPRRRRLHPRLSVRDLEATLAEALGPDATVSKSTVSRVCQAIKDCKYLVNP